MNYSSLLGGGGGGGGDSASSSATASNSFGNVGGNDNLLAIVGLAVVGIFALVLATRSSN